MTEAKSNYSEQNQPSLTPAQVSQLEQPLDPKRVKHRAGGGNSSLAYLKGYDVIDTANRIFGYGQWGYDLICNELTNIAGDQGEIIGGFYTARVRLTVAGCQPITEEGIVAVQEGRNPRAKIDAHDMARKGAITDALKRALRCYGDQFGNSLYDTDLVDGQPRPEVAPQKSQAAPPVARQNVAQPASGQKTTQAGNGTSSPQKPLTQQEYFAKYLAAIQEAPTLAILQQRGEEIKQKVTDLAYRKSLREAYEPRQTELSGSSEVERKS